MRKNPESNTRERILISAKKIFAEKGFEAASMSKIAKVARLDKSSLYYFFKDKEDLFDAVTHRTWQELHDSVIGNLSKKTAGRKKFSKICLDFIVISKNAGLSMTRMQFPKHGHLLNNQTVGLIGDMRHKSIKFLRDEGVNEPELAYELISNAIHSFVLKVSCSPGLQSSPKKYCNYLASLFLKLSQ